MTEVSGTSVRLNLTEEDGVQPGDEFSALEYGEEIARLKIRTVTKRESIADLTLLKPGAILRRLDTVIPSTAVEHPAEDLAPPPPHLAGKTLRPSRSKRQAERRFDDGEVVSRADWAYPALSELATRGVLPNVRPRQFHGDQILTKGEVRRLVADALDSPELTGAPVSPLVKEPPASLPESPAEAASGPSSDSSASAPPAEAPEDPSLASSKRLLYHLAQEYGVESDLPSPKKGLALAHFSRFRLASGDEPTLTASGSYQGFLHMGPQRYAVVSFSRGRREWYGDNGYRWLNEAYLKTRWLGADWEIGQKALRWGPGYSGSMILDDATPSLPMIRGGRGWSLGWLGYWHLDQFISRFRESGEGKYLMGRRLTHPLGRKLALGLSETAKMDKAPNPAALVLPFYAYQKLFHYNTNEINVQAGLDLSYRSGRNEAYGELFIDDITAPKPLRGQEGKVPRKIGFLAGWHRSALFGQEGTDLRVEYAQTDRNTYLHRNPSLSYYDRGIPLGHPMGPNSQSLLIRADRRISDRLEVTGAVQFLSRNVDAAPDSAKGTAFTLAAAYDLADARSIILKISPGRRVDRYPPNASGSVELIADWAF